MILLTPALHPTQAISVYDQALTLLHGLPSSDYTVVAEAYSRLGTLLEEKGNIEASLHAWKEALQISSTKSMHGHILPQTWSHYT